MFNTCSPFKKTNAFYNLDKPIVVGEFSTPCSESMDPVKNYKYLYINGSYAGALSWHYKETGDCTDTRVKIDQGMNAIKTLTSNGKIRVITI